MLIMKKLRSIIVESNRNGKGYMIVKCPFCEREFPIFRSTLSGARRQCSCGALLGESYWTKEENENEYNNEGDIKLV